MAITFGKTVTNPLRYKITAGTWSAQSFAFAPASGLSIGDSIVFSNTNANGGQFSNLTINVATAVAATTFTGVWEYAQKVGNNNAVITWAALSGVVDNTNGFTTAGNNTVSWTLPTDWTNWVVISSLNANYFWHVRFRITGMSGVTNNGSISTATNYLPLVELTGTQTLTMADIATASASGGWDAVVSNAVGGYHIKKVIWVTSANITLTSKNEVWNFERNCFFLASSSSPITFGETDASGNDVNGSILYFNNYGGDYSGITILPSNGVMRATNIYHILRGGFTSGNGHWGAGIGTNSNQTVSSVFIQNMRSYNFLSNTNVLKNMVFYTDIGLTTSGQAEPMSATMVNNKWINGLAMRHSNADVNKYSHRTDASLVYTYPISIWQPSTSGAEWYHVDMKRPPVTDANLVYWSSGGSSANWSTMKVGQISSIVYKTIDNTGTAISGAKFSIFDKDNVEVVTTTSNADGYCSDYFNTVAAASTTSQMNLGTNSNGTRRFKEVFYTSGTLVGQRSVIHVDGTTYFTLAEPTKTAPAINNRVMTLPYVVPFFNKKATVATGYGEVDTRGPFRLVFRKYGKLESISTSLLRDPVNNSNTLLTDPIITETNEATVAALSSKIIINHVTQTAEITGNVTKNELYDHAKYDLTLPANMTYDDWFISTDDNNFACAYNLTLNGGNLTGTGTINMPTKTLTITSTEVSTMSIVALNGNTGYLNITGLDGHSLLLLDDTATQLDYEASVTGTYNYFTPPDATGTWKVVIKKAGYKHQVITFTPATGGAFTYATNTPQKLTPEGLPMYTGTTHGMVSVSFTGTTQANIDIGDGIAPLQPTLDETEDALCTNDGLLWLASGKNDVAIFNSFGGDFLFETSGWRLREAVAGNSNATLQAYVVSEDGIPVDDVNGPVMFLTTDTPTAIANAVIDAGVLTLDEFLALK